MDDDRKAKKTKYVGDYIVGKTLGIGTFGKVCLCTHKITGKKVAIKTVPYAVKARARDLAIKEASLMKYLQHNHIVKLEDVIDNEERQEINLILEYVSGGELFDYVASKGVLSEDEAKKFFCQIISALDYCHQNMIIHRDLKLENILLDSEKNVKVNDFGLGKQLMNADNIFKMQTNCGSPLYSSPEIIRRQSYIGPEVDIWAAGVILYALVTGSQPWDGDTLQEQIEQAMNGRYYIPDEISDECRDLISKMLEVDIKKRATIAEIRAHPWAKVQFMHLKENIPERPIITSEDQIDKDILEQLEPVGFSQQEIVNDLLNNEKTKQTYCYYFLALEMKRREIERQNQLSPPKATQGTLEELKLQNEPEKSVASPPKHHSWGSETELQKSEVQESETTKTRSANFSHSPPGSPMKKKGSKLFNLFKRNNGGMEKKKSLRTLTGNFSETTSTKTIEELQAEIDRVLNGIQNATVKTKDYVYSVAVNNDGSMKRPLKFKIEICQVRKLEHLLGLKFSRVSGDPFDYKKTCDAIRAQLKL